MDLSNIENLKEIVEKAESFAEIFRELKIFGFSSVSYKMLKKELTRLNMSFTHINFSSKGRKIKSTRLSKEEALEKYFCITSRRIGGKNLKSFIKRWDLIPHNTCSICGISDTWNDKQLIFVLDHIDGNCVNNNLDNLRLLCPNCNSQTDTFCGKNTKTKNKCIDCAIKISGKQNKRCFACFNKQKKARKFDPSKEELTKLVWEMPTTKVGQKFGVSDKAIENRCKIFGIDKPPRGYWRKASLEKEKQNEK